eukprot:9896742-Alexandrium_andersonii.AAC.1
MSASLVGSEMCIRDRAPWSSPELLGDPRSSPKLPRALQRVSGSLGCSPDALRSRAGGSPEILSLIHI